MNNATDLLKGIADLARPINFGDSEPTRETFLGHAQNPDGKLKLITAYHLLNYLDTHPAVGEEAEAHRDARSLCYAVMNAERRKRFETLDTHAAEVDRIPPFAGQYVLIRQDTVQQYLYEILLLEPQGKNPAAPFATLIQREVVHRGTWRVMRRTLHCHFTGFTPDYGHDVVNLYLSLGDRPSETYGGFLAGITTSDGFPVVMPVIIVRLRDAHPSLARLTDLGDCAARALLCAADSSLGGLSKLVEGTFEEALPVSEIRPADIAIPIGQALRERHGELISQVFREFLEKDHSDNFLHGVPTAKGAG